MDRETQRQLRERLLQEAQALLDEMQAEIEDTERFLRAMRRRPLTRPEARATVGDVQMKQFSTLRNGARVLQQEGDVVLCEWDRGSHVDYVTWRVDQEGNAFWGHYARSLRVAAREFEARVAGR